MNKTILILGAGGFVGKELTARAVQSGWRVKALVRSDAGARELSEMGAEPIIGSAEAPDRWMQQAMGVNAIVDLIQPKIPRKLGTREIAEISSERQRITAGFMKSLASLPAAERPLWIEVSGIDDLQPDANGRIDSHSPLRSTPVGFASIGVPVRKLIELSGLTSAFVYLGTVYGPGKTFASAVFPKLAANRWKTPGSGDNRVPLVHVEDAARGLLHVAGLDRSQAQGRSYVLTDGANTRLNDFFEFAAAWLGARKPGHVPKWLASLIAGRPAVETMTRDLDVTPFFAQEPGFRPTFPSFREGLPPTLTQLGYTHRAAPTPRNLAGRLPFLLLAIAALGAFLALNALDFPLSVQGMRNAAGGLSILDARIRYSVEEAYRLFDALGEAGRTRYLMLLWTVDLMIPALFALFLSAAIEKGSFRRVRRLPYVAAGMDYLENLAITVLLLNYPERWPLLASVAAVLTLGKQIAYWTSAGFALAGGLGRILPRKRGEA